jgi:hypothetical protein
MVATRSASATSKKKFLAKRGVSRASLPRVSLRATIPLYAPHDRAPLSTVRSPPNRIATVCINAATPQRAKLPEAFLP